MVDVYRHDGLQPLWSRFLVCTSSTPAQENSRLKGVNSQGIQLLFLCCYLLYLITFELTSSDFLFFVFL